MIDQYLVLTLISYIEMTTERSKLKYKVFLRHL